MIFSDSIQQADLFGPWYIMDDSRFYSLNVIDIESYLTIVYPCWTNGDKDMAPGLIWGAEE